MNAVPEALAESLQPLLEMALLLAVILLGSRLIFGYVARLAAWVDSGFRWSPGPVTTGAEGMLLRRGVASTPLDPRGKVKVAGEVWNAVAVEPVTEGGEVVIVAVEGLTLEVAPCQGDGAEQANGAEVAKRAEQAKGGG